MRTTCVLILVLTAVPSWAQTIKQNPAAIKQVADLIAKAEGPYSELANGVWQTSYTGKNIPLINVKIATAEDGVFFFVTLFQRDKLVLSRNLLLKVAELNSDYDYAKLALDDDSLNVRVDVRLNTLRFDEFKALENQAAVVADEAFAVLRDFLP